MDEKIIDEKLLSGHVDSKLVDEFLDQAFQRGQKKKRTIAAAVRLWIDLPEEIQARLLNQSMGGSALIDLVNQIVDKRIAAQKKLR